MIQRRFPSWNWQRDFGEGPISNDEPLPARYAIAYYDHRGRLYRLVCRVKELADLSDDDPSAYGLYVYDYYCDFRGHILQKRSLDENGSIVLIIDYEYDVAKAQITEIAWCPLDENSKPVKHSRPL